MRKPLIMVVEDDRELGGSIVEVLEFLDFETELVTDGLSAYDRIAAKLPEIVLLDIHLPGKSGLDVLSEIRADARLAKTKVVMTTADGLRTDALAEKADFVLIKPYSIVQLGEVTARLMKENNSSV